jgi:molecular chaperone DnaK
MGYFLGIDLGTTYTAAAVVRDGPAQIVELGTKAAVVPSVLFLSEDEAMLTGDAAIRRAATDPSRVSREFKRRVGDPAPILLGGSPWSAQALIARLLRWTVDAVTEREGGPPAHIGISHPANWGPYKLDLLGEAVRLAELSSPTTFVTEPEAAAIAYASNERIEVGDVVAVYDLGGGTFDAAVLRKTLDGFDILGEPEGIDRLGGIDFDAAILAFVTAALDGAVEALDPADPGAMAALARLRAECADAKEALSSDTETSIPVALPGLHTEVRLTRAELEAMIRPPLSDTIAALRRALRNADVQADDVDVVLLVGGSSRIPLVADLVGQELARPVVVDAHPKHVVASGAALAVQAAGARPVPEAAAVSSAPAEVVEAAAAVEVVEPDPVELAPVPVAPTPVAPAPPFEPPPARPGAADGAAPAERRSPRRGSLVGASLVLVLLVAAVGGFLLLGGDDDDGGGDGGAGAVAATGVEETVACPAADEPAVCIEEVAIDGGVILASFAAQGVTLTDPTGGRFPADSLHALFFFDSIDPGEGRVWGQGSPFGDPASDLPGFDTGDAPGSTTALCVLIQDDQGTIFESTGNCVAMPSVS